MDILGMLGKQGAILTDHHFVYKSGKHGPHYINMDPVFPDTAVMNEICGALGLPFRGTNTEVDTVIGAATGAIPLAALTALRLGDGGRRPYPNYAWADKQGDDFAIARAGFIPQLTGKHVLVVEDLLNTGDTVKKVIAQVRRHGGKVVGVSVVCNRGPETAKSLGVPRLEQLASVDFQVLDADTCSLCAEGRPIVADIGHGDAYKSAHPDYAGGYVSLLS